MDIKIDVSGEMEPNPIDSHATGLKKIFTNIPNLREFFIQLRENLRPWLQFFETQNFKSCSSVQTFSNRLKRNLSYFQSNYLCVFIVLLIYCLITSPLILFVLAGVFYACYKARASQVPLTVFGKRFNTTQQCFAINLAALPILYIMGAGSILFWVIGASFFVISLHAAFYNIDAIVTEDTENFLLETV